MIKQFFITVLSMLVAMQTAVAQPRTGIATVDLFNGRNLDGWINVNCTPETWQVRDGMIVCSGIPYGILRTTRQYENYILELDWRHMKPKGNAGLFVHSGPLPHLGRPWTRAHEVQIMDGDHGAVFPIWGAFLAPDNPRKMKNKDEFMSRAFPIENRSKPAGEWNHYRVESRDGMIILSVNGKRVTRGFQANPRKGYICLESEGSEIHFRNIRIQELPSTDPHPSIISDIDEGFRSLYNGVDLRGWVNEPGHAGHWKAQGYILQYDGKSEAPARRKNLVTEKSYGNFELRIDWRMTAKSKLYNAAIVLSDGQYARQMEGDAGRPGLPWNPPDDLENELTIPIWYAADSGIMFRGSTKSQVNIWNWPVGSGEIWGYRTDPSMFPEVRKACTPIQHADNKAGEWNRFVIRVVGDRVRVELNGKLVIEDAQLPGLPDRGPIMLQHHGDPVEFCNIFIKELD
jgi:hypothetical protein